jgi:hypothetical protein
VLLWCGRCTLVAWSLLCVATLLALISLARYMKNVWRFFIYPDSIHKHQ